MIFPKQYLSDALDKKYKQTLYKNHPYQTHYKEDEKSPAELLIMNFFTFFDLRSNELKDLAYRSRIDIVNNCFNDDVMDIYPNTFKIEQCIKKTNFKYYGKYLNERQLFFGNSKRLFKIFKLLVVYHYNESTRQIPLSEGDKKLKMATENIEKLLWDSFKSKYFFNEKFPSYV